MYKKRSFLVSSQASEEEADASQMDPGLARGGQEFVVLGLG